MSGERANDPAAPVEAAAAAATRRGGRGRVLRALEVAFAVALLGFVAWNLPWRDRLVIERGEARVEIPGRILGDWRGERARFRVDPEATPAPGWPAPIVAAARAGEPVELARGALEGAEVSWSPGLPRVFLDVDARGLAGALSLLFLGALFGVTRWWRLLRLAGCGTRWPAAARLTFLGLFFNLVLPGLTGGDLVKAGLAVRDHPHARADALVSVVIDRVIGLWALLGLASTVLLLATNEAFDRLRGPVLLAFAGATLAVVLALHPAWRRLIRLERWIEKLPQARRLTKLDRAARLYGGHPLEIAIAFALSLGNHLCTAAALMALGAAFGAALGFAEYVAVGSIANTITSLPLAPGGWGLGEAAYGTLFALLGSAATLGVAVSVSYRLLLHAIGFGGGLALLLPAGRAERRRARELGAALEEAS